jgi:hypothetical protein
VQTEAVTKVIEAERSRAMLCRFPVVSLFVAVGSFTLAITSHAQTAPLWIQSVTIDAAAGTATITGTGFRETCEVTLDGHALTVLPGGTAARLVVVAPAALLATPGTYRRTVTEAGRQAGDASEITIADRPAGALLPAPATAASWWTGSRRGW